MKIFISHKQEDYLIAEEFASILEKNNVEYYLDVLDNIIINNGRRLTEHIKKNLNSCTDIIVIMTENTMRSEWVPFEVGMASNAEKKIATYLDKDVRLPSYLEYWPRLKKTEDILTYISINNEIEEEYDLRLLVEGLDTYTSNKIDLFYSKLKEELNKK